MGHLPRVLAWGLSRAETGDVCHGWWVGGGAVCVSVGTAYLRREEDLLFLECQCRTCWRNGAIRRAKGQNEITLPRGMQALSSLRGLESARWRRHLPVPGSSETVTRCSQSFDFSETLAMLGTLMTALFFVVRAFGQLGTNLFREEPLPYLVYQPLPWQIQCVTQSRRTSRDSERGRSSRHNSIYSVSGEKGSVTPDASSESKFFSDPSEKAAVTIQTHFRRYQQQKQEKK